MMIKILKDEKNEIDVELDNLTIVELLRVYANENGAKLAAWRREHPTKNPILHIEGEGASKILQKTIAAIQKDLDKYSEEFKKMK
jgi:DNA-directed RNA polymerase subunit L